MKPWRALFVALVMAVLATVTWSPPLRAADPDGSVKGSLINRTPGGAGVANQDVILKTFVGDQARGQTSTKTDSQGRFGFSGVNTASDYSYELIVTYQEAEYLVGPRQFEPGSNTLNWDVSVYDSTPKPDQIRIGLGHLIINVSEETLTVLQFFSFVNNGDRTFVGSHPITPDGKKETIRLSLPTTATEITSNEGLDECCAFRTDQGISDTLAVEPGAKDVVLSYQLPVKSSAIYLDLPLYYPVDTLNLLVGDQRVKVSSPQLEPQGIQDFGGQKYLHFSGKNLPADAELSIDLTNLPQKGVLAGRLDTNTLRWSGVGLAALAIGIALFYSLRKRPAAVAAPAARRGVDRVDLLVRELADLDDRFAAGQIREDDYEKIKEEKEQRLKDLLPPREGEA